MPTEKAHGLQIVKMCEAFARQGATVVLAIPMRLNQIKEDPFNFYGVEKNFKFLKLLCLDFLWFPFFKNISFWLENLSFTFFAFIKALFMNDFVFYTREASITFFLSLIKPVFYEMHTIPQGGLWFHGVAWKRAKGIIVISDGIKRDLVKTIIYAAMAFVLLAVLYFGNITYNSISALFNANVFLLQ